MNKKVKAVIKAINFLIVTITVLFVALTVGVKLFGIHMYTVLSGSMEPEYPVGSLLYVKEVDADSLEEGDVITFRLTESTIATHRIVEIVPDEDGSGGISFRTKGDANETVDAALVKDESVIGTPIVTLPEMGYFASYIQNPPGRYFAVGVGVFLILFVFVSDSVLDEKDDKKKDEKGSDEKA